MSRNPLDTKRSANRMVLLLCVAFILTSAFIPPLLPQGNQALFRLLATLVIEGALLLPALLFMRNRGGLPAFGFTRPHNRALLWSVGLGIAGFLLATGINSILQALWTALNVLTLSSAETAFMGGGWNILVSFLTVVLLPAYIEETVFRGALLHAWLPQNRTLALWRCALLFALLHMNPMSFPAYVVLGLLFGSATIVSGSIYPAMIMHGVNNFIVMLLSYMTPAEFTAAAEEALLPGQYLFAGTVYVVLGLLVGRACYRRFRTATAQAENNRRMLYGYDPDYQMRAIFLPPEQPAPEGEGDTTDADAPISAQPDLEPLQPEWAAQPESAEPPEPQAPPPVPQELPDLPDPSLAASPDAQPPQRTRLAGTGRLSLLLTYLLLLAVNLYMLLLAAGAFTL